MAKEKPLKTLETKFIFKDKFRDESDFQEAVKRQRECFEKQYIGCEIQTKFFTKSARITVKESAKMKERRELVDKLFFELNEYVPNWRLVSKDTTAKELEQHYDAIFSEKISFDNVWNYIQHHSEGLKLKESEVPKGLWFSLILFAIYGQEQFSFWDCSDRVIFDVSDDKTDKKLISIENLLKVRKNGLLSNVKKDYFFERIVEIRDFLELLEKTGF